MRSVPVPSLNAALLVIAFVLYAGTAGAQLPVSKPRPEVSPRQPVRDSLPIRQGGDSSVLVGTPRGSGVTPGGSTGGSTTGGRPTGTTPGGNASTTKDPLRGRYRVVLTGFTVNQQSYDNPLQLDGKGDEVYFAAYVARFDTTAADLVDQQILSTKVHGDVNGFPERKQAGFASGRGGIRSGDRFPFPTPFKPAGALSMTELPMVLWEGELVQGQSAVLITPTVWEWDDDPELFAYWAVGRGEFVERLLEPDILSGILDNRFWLPMELGAPGLLVHTNMFADARDRPIGLDVGRATSDRFAEPVHGSGGTGSIAAIASDDPSLIERFVSVILGNANTLAEKYERIARDLLKGGEMAGRIPLPPPRSAAEVRARLRSHAATGRSVPLASIVTAVVSALRDRTATEVYFFEKALVLTPEAIDAALRSSSRVGGRPPGIIDVPYVDHSPLAGRYVLHIQVERLP
jgi:hypothetical protein